MARIAADFESRVGFPNKRSPESPFLLGEDDMKKDRVKKSVRIAKLKIIGVEGDYGEDKQEAKRLFKEAKQRWKDRSVIMRRVLNDMRMQWLAAHLTAGDDVTVREWIENDIAWVRTPKKESEGKRARCPVECWPKDINHATYKTLAERHPYTNIRCITLAMNTEQQTLKMAPASKSAYPRWMRILCGDGEFPSSSQPQPIPFDKSNGEL